MNKEVKIYGLYDPRESNHIRYIGKTTRELCHPLNRHRTCLNQKPTQWNRKHHWIKSLVDDNIKFEIIHLFSTTDEHWEEVERDFIKSYREEGHDLTNKHRGGSCNFYDVAYDPLSKEEIGQRIVAGRIQKNGPDTFKRDTESVARGIETKRATGNWGRTPENIARQVATRRVNGSYERNDEAIAKQLATKLERGVNKPNKGSFGSKPLTPEMIAKRTATKARNYLLNKKTQT